MADLVQTLFVEELTRAGIEAKPIAAVLTKDHLPTMRQAGEQAGAAYVLGGRVLVFEIVYEVGWTIVSRRSITLEVDLAQVSSGDLVLDTTVTQNQREEEVFGARASTDVDRLLNTVFRQVVFQVVEQVAAKLAFDPRDVDVQITMVPR